MEIKGMNYMTSCDEKLDEKDEQLLHLPDKWATHKYPIPASNTDSTKYDKWLELSSLKKGQNQFI